MTNSIIPFPLTSNHPRCARCETAARTALRYSVNLLDLARATGSEPTDCAFAGYRWLAGEVRAVYEHTDTGAIAAFGYDAGSRKLVYFCALNY